MSDGISDSNALSALHNKVEFAAMDLRDALEAADEGHRGMTVRTLDIVNTVLRDCGYRLVKERP